MTLTQGVYSSSCGHGMHMECWRRFHDSRITELRQSDLLFQRRSAVNYESGEFPVSLVSVLLQHNIAHPSRPSEPKVHVYVCMYVYTETFGGDFNLAVWRC